VNCHPPFAEEKGNYIMKTVGYSTFEVNGRRLRDRELLGRIRSHLDPSMEPSVPIPPLPLAQIYKHTLLLQNVTGETPSELIQQFEHLHVRKKASKDPFAPAVEKVNDMNELYAVV